MEKSLILFYFYKNSKINCLKEKKMSSQRGQQQREISPHIHQQASTIKVNKGGMWIGIRVKLASVKADRLPDTSRIIQWLDGHKLGPD